MATERRIVKGQPPTRPRKMLQRRDPERVPATHGNTKHNWPEAERLFVEGDQHDDGSIVLLNLKEVSERMNIPYQSVRERSVKWRWPDKRNQFQAAAAKERQRKRVQEMSKQAGEFDNNAYQTAKIGLTLVANRLAEIAREVTAKEPLRRDAMERLRNGELVEDKWLLYSAIHHRELEGLASAADKFQVIGMRALGTDIQRHEFTSPDGTMASTTVNIHAEMTRDDPKRLYEFLQAAQNSDLLQRMLEQEADIIEGETVDEPEEEQKEA